MSKVSIIMPVFNCEEYLVNSIESVLEQSYGQLELILVNDGSTDKSAEICNKYAMDDLRVKVIHQKNAGPSAARNKGIYNSNYEYIMFIDADDTYEYNMLEIMIKAIEESHADLVICGINRIYASTKGEEINSISFEKNRTYSNKSEIFGNIDELIESELLNAPVNKLYKTCIIINNNLYMDETLDIGEDFQFNLQYIEHVNSISIIKDMLYNYHLANSFLTNKFRENIFEIRKVPIENLRHFYIRNGVEHDISDYLFIKLAFACFMQLFHKDNKKTKLENFNYIKMILNKPEIISASKNIKPKGLLQKNLAFVLKSKSVKLIYYFTKLLVLVREKKIIRIKRVSV